MARGRKSIYRHVVKCRTCAPQTLRAGQPSLLACSSLSVPCISARPSRKRFGACIVKATLNREAVLRFIFGGSAVSREAVAVARPVLGTVVIGTVSFVGGVSARFWHADQHERQRGNGQSSDSNCRRSIGSKKPDHPNPLGGSLFVCSGR
jgi:hypothetical protein